MKPWHGDMRHSVDNRWTTKPTVDWSVRFSTDQKVLSRNGSVVSWPDLMCHGKVFLGSLCFCPASIW